MLSEEGPIDLSDGQMDEPEAGRGRWHRSVMLLKGRLVDSHLGALCTRCQDSSVSALISLLGEPILCLLQHLLDLECC